MHVVVGDPQDPFCRSVRTVLEGRGFQTGIIPNPLVRPSRFVWRLDNDVSASQFAWDDEPAVLGEHILGVLVRGHRWIDPTGWQQDDLAYMQSEMLAALLAWMWSLACPVVNRYSAAIWYQPQVPLVAWQPYLRQCGMSGLEAMVTNVEQEARDFGRQLAREGVAGVVYGPLTSPARYLVTTEEEWSGLAAMQQVAPACLTYPHGPAQLVCVVGERVVWDGDPAADVRRFEPALRRFARATGLAFVELAFAPTSRGVRVVAVEPHPHVERFGDAAQEQIVEAIADLLTVDTRSGRPRAAPAVRESSA